MSLQKGYGMQNATFWESTITVGIRLLSKLSAILITAYASLWVYQILSKLTSQGL